MMVEWKKLDDLLDYEQPTPYLVKSTEYDDSYSIPVLTAGQSLLLGYTNETDGIYKACKDNPCIIFDDFTTSFHWIDFDFKVKSSAMKMLRPKKCVNFRYVYYAMLGINFIPGGHQRHWISKYSQFEIPIPPLSEQERIVGILDTFTASIDNLKEQIAQRRKQYEYYRDQLLDLEGKPGVEMKKISDIAKNFTGLTYSPKNVSDEGTLVLRSSNINEDKLSFEDNVFVQMEIPERTIVHENDILICVRNGSKRLVGKAAMITKEADGMAFGAFMTILRTNDVNSKFLFYAWQSNKIKKQYKGDESMPIAQITAKDFQRIDINIPPLSEQQRIVSILDTFEASIANLEAQLEQRQKQYEYYRNKLLTFE